MSSYLDRVKDWDDVATECGFQVKTIARKFMVSERTLERHFRKRFGLNPKTWINVTRLRIAAEQISRGDSVKAIATDLNFKQRSTFSNFFKRHKGAAPTNYAKKL